MSSILPNEVSVMINLLKRTTVALEKIAEALGNPVTAPGPVVVPDNGRTNSAPSGKAIRRDDPVTPHFDARDEAGRFAEEL